MVERTWASASCGGWLAGGGGAVVDGGGEQR